MYNARAPHCYNIYITRKRSVSRTSFVERCAGWQILRGGVFYTRSRVIEFSVFIFKFRVNVNVRACHCSKRLRINVSLHYYCTRRWRAGFRYGYRRTPLKLYRRRLPRRPETGNQVVWKRIRNPVRRRELHGNGNKAKGVWTGIIPPRRRDTHLHLSRLNNG